MTFRNKLINHIKKRGGALALDEYMGLCNHHYYNTRDPFGTDGDFTTAPEISQMFGELIAAWLVDILGQFGAKGNVTLLECGPGRGTLMKDIVNTANKINNLNVNFNIILLEQSDTLKAVQKESLRGVNVKWIGDIQDLPHNLSTDLLFVIGNEFFDALPIKQYMYQDNNWHERVVTYDASLDNFVLELVNTDFIPQLSDPKEGDIFEHAPAINDFTSILSKIIKRQGGGALFIDYGYPKTAFGDTFQAVHQHKYINPLLEVGEADLTAHVNFETLKDIFYENDLHTYGPTTQGAFLTQLGLPQRAETLKIKASEAQKQDIQAAAKRLTSSDEMGTLFKVIATFSKPLTPAGFAEEIE